MKWTQENKEEISIRNMDREHLINAILWMARSKGFSYREKDGLYLTEWVHRMSKELRRRDLKEKSFIKAKGTHITRMSDSSLYDEVCTVCGATDAMGDNRLNKKCTGKQ